MMMTFASVNLQKCNSFMIRGFCLRKRKLILAFNLPRVKTDKITMKSINWTRVLTLKNMMDSISIMLLISYERCKFNNSKLR